MRWLKTFPALAAALFGALLTTPGPGHAQSIANTARAIWVQGGVAGSAISNTVVTAVEPSAVRIDLFHTSLAGEQTTVPTSLCGGQPLELVPGSATGSMTLRTAATDTVRVGEILVLQIAAPLANANPGAIETLSIQVKSQAGDQEAIVIHETGANTGIFMGAIRTVSIPPQPLRGDCRLSVNAGDSIVVEVEGRSGAESIASKAVGVLADPFGLVFDSVDGAPVSGAVVTLIDANTGLPARVFAEDGVTPWPSTVTTGAPVVDAAGNVYQMVPGEFRFPLTSYGDYRLAVVPPSPYSSPSTATPAALARLTRPGGKPFQIREASFGQPFVLQTPDAVRVDYPVDRPSVGVTLTKTAGKARVQPGDPVFYTLTITNPDPGHPQVTTQLVDTPSPWLRLRRDSFRIDGQPAPQALTVTPDGRRLSINPGTIAPGGTVRVTYVMTVGTDAPAGQATNHAETLDATGNRAVAEATVRVERDTIAARMTLIGRVAAGSCRAGEPGLGIPGVRVMLEDGSFALTDRDGRYHFEGLVPGTHVVAIAPATLPAGARPLDCAHSTRSAGSAISRFVTGQGGSLAVVDFRAETPNVTDASSGRVERVADAAAATSEVRGPQDDGGRQVTSDRAASGADTDWLALGNGPTDFLFPAMDYNPRIPSIRAVIRHQNGQKIALRINNQPVDKLAFEGTKGGPGNAWAVSVWRGIPLSGTRNVLTATVTNPDGSVAVELERVVQYVSAPWRAEIVPGRSHLVADGKSRPVVAVRFTDRAGRPVRSGVTGSFAVGEPYQSAAQLDQLQLAQLSGPGGPNASGGSATWTIESDDGVAMIELAPTMVSGPLHLGFDFVDEDLTRRQQLEGWVVPGDLPFTLVGLAEGTVGAKSVADQMERGNGFDSDLGDDARVAFYAKGRIPGNMLLTLAYDSAKEKAGERLLGAIDPSAYYTIYADGSTRRYDAASTEKLYVRLEASAFYALYGDFVTGFDQTQLARYQRTLTGVKAETRVGALHAQAFAAKVAGRHRRDEIQGAGISGPYALRTRDILANSEQVAIEVRDRFRSEIVLSRQELTRFIDYTIDPLTGTISFKAPVLSRDFDLNPQFIVIDYEAASGFGDAQWNAGGRADLTFGKTTEIRIGATALSDRGEDARTGIGGVDLRARIGVATEIRAEAALSRRDSVDSTAWLVEAEHRTGKLDLLAYARQADSDFGTGQQSAVELGRRKFGIDGRYQLSERASFVARSWFEESTVDASSRFAAEAGFVYRGLSGEGRIALAHRTDTLADGSSATATMLEGQATKRLLGNRLELGVGANIPLADSGSIDLPARHTFRGRFALTDAVRLVGTYETTKGQKISSQNFNLGFELAPWSGARLVSTIGRQDIAEAGTRSYAAFGLAQSLPLSKHLTLDATVDGNRKIGGASLRDLVNPLHPNSSGGQLSPDGALFEDFTAATLGLGWRMDNWSATVRGELRNGEYADRRGVIAGLVRQLGDGVTVGGGASWTRSSGANAATTEVTQAALAAAFRPAASRFAGLAKLEYRGDKVSEAVIGQLDPTGRTALTVNGDARAERLVASLSTNFRPGGKRGEDHADRSEIGAFVGLRYNLDSAEQQQLASTALAAGLDARVGLGSRVEIGGSATLRANLTDGTTAYAFGPQIGISPAKNTLVTIGYNVKGFRDPDFSAARHTDQGIYASVKLKFDSDSLGFLGLRR